MAFLSQYAHLIWERLYTVDIPDTLTLNPDYIRKFGVLVSGDKKIDEALSNLYVTVKIPIIRILEYYLNGIDVRIKRREDLIEIHKNIELYLEEWRAHLTHDVNIDYNEYKDLLNGLEKLSKHIYNKLNTRELISDLFSYKNIGIVNRIKEVEEQTKEIKKPNYEGISSLIKRHSQAKKKNNRF